MNIYNLIDDICRGYNPTKEEVEALLCTYEPYNSYLFLAAQAITKKYHKNIIHIRGIIEFSNYCRCSCTYCGLNAANKKLKRYRMEPKEIVETAKEAYDAGYRTLVLQREKIYGIREKKSLK